MSFEIASVTTCGQELLARATATNKLVFVNAKIETTARTVDAIGSASSLPTLTNPVDGAINSVTYSLNQTRVTVRFNNLVTTANFHTVWLMAKLANEEDSLAVPICAVVSSEPVYIPTTSQSDTHIDIHLNLSFVRADGTVSITEGPAWMISDQIQYRNEVRAELDDIEADIDDLQRTVVTIGDAQIITGNKTFGGTFKVTGSTTLSTTTTGTLTSGTLTSYGHTPRTNSTSSSTGYDLGSTSYRWRTVYAQYGNFNTSISTDGTLSVTGASTLTGNTTVGGTLGVTGATTLDDTLDVTGETTLSDVTAGEITSTNHVPTANSTSTSTGSDLGASGTRWRYVYGRYGNFSGSISTAGTLSVTGDSTLSGNVSVDGTLGVTGSTTLAEVTAGAVQSYAITPRTASTSSSTGYDLGASDNRWKYVYARYGNFSYSVTVTNGITVGGSITRPTGSTATQNIGSSALPFSYVYTNYLGATSYPITSAYITSAYFANMYSSGTSAVKCLVLGTNNNYANDLEIPGTDTDGSRGYLHPSSDYGADLGSQNRCFNKLWVKNIKAYGKIEDQYGDTSTYIKTITTTTATSSNYTVYNSASGTTTSSSLSLYNSSVKATKGDNTTSTTSLGGPIAAALTASGAVGMLRFVAFKTTGAWTKKNDGIYVSGSILRSADVRTVSADSDSTIRLNATTTLNNGVYSGTWKILHSIAAISSGDMFFALAVRVA